MRQHAASDVQWAAVTVLASGPEAELKPVYSSLGGCGAHLNDSSLLREDGRMHVSASGLCFAEAASPARTSDEVPQTPPTAVVFTCASVLAPFFKRRARATVPDAGQLRPIVDVDLVPTTELFVLFDRRDAVLQKGGEDAAGGDGSASSPFVALRARVAACIPMQEAEVEYAALQKEMTQRVEKEGRADASNSRDTRTASAQGDAAGVEFSPPTVGALAVAILHVLEEDWEADAIPLRHADAAHLISAALPTNWSLGQRVQVYTSPFGMLAPSLFMGISSSSILSARRAGSALALLHFHCLSGCEGGVVASYGGGSSSSPDGMMSVPLALLSLPLRSGADGQRLDVSCALSLRAIAEAVLRCGLPHGAIPDLLGHTTSALLLQLAGEVWTTMASGPALQSGEAKWLCWLTPPSPTSPASQHQSSELTAAAVVLHRSGTRCIVLADARAVERVAAGSSAVSQSGAAFKCLVEVPTPRGQAASFDGRYHAAVAAASIVVLHRFACLASSILLRLEFTEEALCSHIECLPLCLTSPRRPDGAASASTSAASATSCRCVQLVDKNAYAEGSEVYALCLSHSSKSRPTSGLLRQAASGSRTWRPAALQVAFPRCSLWPSDSDPTSDLWIAFRQHPEPALLGVRFAGAGPSASCGTVLPQGLLMCGAAGMVELLDLLEAYSSGAGAAGAASRLLLLEQMEARWPQPLRQDVGALLWSIERGPAAVPRRSRL
eukprot:TRINITY_DN41612_c0_g1_i1.p1 TRINITY_DN41612_c0_g1~~TRINITY_DN41612_c0_g1_i1.p1  ORF type:complete len:725 (+),score=135.97 TRINITY_DN41612_c0_g1_i1:114-2288(+)